MPLLLPYLLSSSAALIPPQAASLGSGMLAGAIGVGVAYPLDTIKVKVQAAASRSNTVQSSSTLSLVQQLVAEDGLSAFYGGVSATMAGQAAIKGVAFFSYETARQALGGDDVIGVGAALLAACLSGGAAAFVSTPVERVKVVMQAADAGEFSSPLQCINQLVAADGLNGALFRGLGATIVREVPSYGLYFGSYELVAAAIQGFGPVWFAPLVGGAAAGAASWVPVYPIDVVKTAVQVDLDGGKRESFGEATMRLWRAGGMGIFWDGLTPKLLRAVVNHAVTFVVYEELMSALPIAAAGVA